LFLELVISGRPVQVLILHRQPHNAYAYPVKRRLIALLAALTFSFSFVPSSFAADVDEQKVLEMKQRGDGGWIGMTFENPIKEYLPSHIYVDNLKRSIDNNNEGLETVICTSAKDPVCLKDGYAFYYRAVLPPCESEEQLDCIQSITAKLPDGKSSEGTVVRKWNTALTYSGDVNLRIPDGGAQSTWKIPGSNPGGSEEYALTAVLDGRQVLDLNSNVGNIPYSNLQVNLKPIREVTGMYQEPTSSVGAVGLGKGFFTNTVPSEKGCVIAERNRCALAASFNLDTQFSIKLRLSRNPNQWMHGRLSDPSVMVNPISNGAQLLTVTANPIEVPTVAGWVRWNDLPAAIKSKYPQGAGGTGADNSDFTTTDLANRILRVGMRAAGKEALDDFKLWNPLLEDKPLAMRTMWSLRSITNSDPAIRACDGRGLSGLVTTNAAVYSDGPPSFDKESQSLNYTVGAPHYDTSNKVFSGSYSLIMNSEVARCIYGFSNAPISAKIEVAAEDGSSSVAVTTLNQKDGWMRLSAYGFHYSTPQIKIKLTQEKVVEAAAAPSATPIAASTAEPKKSSAVAVKAKPSKAVALTITCIKGSSTKKITAAKPKCPSGYKKK
jgi:hypothetical protein